MTDPDPIVELTDAQKISAVAQEVQARMDVSSSSDGAVAAPTAIELANIMVSAMAMLNSGDPLGTTLFHEETKETADRLIVDNLPTWRITTPGQMNPRYDNSPTLAGWTVLYRPGDPPADPGE